MEMVLFWLRGILIGLLVGFPLGAVGTLVIQRVLNSGNRAGWLTGLASSAADCIYAGVGVFGLSLISERIFTAGAWIRLAGSALIIFMGINSIVRKTDEVSGTAGCLTDAKMFFSAFLVGITNPTVIIVLLLAFSYFDLSAGMNMAGGIVFITGVFAGTFVWWIILISVVDHFREKAAGHMKVINRVLGALLIVFGGIILIKAAAAIL